MVDTLLSFVKPFIDIKFKKSPIITLWNKTDHVESMCCMLHKARKEEAVTHVSGLRHSSYNRRASCLNLLFSLSTVLLHGLGSHMHHPHNEPFHLAFQNFSLTHGTGLAPVPELRPVATPQTLCKRHLFTECWQSSVTSIQARCL